MALPLLQEDWKDQQERFPLALERLWQYPELNGPDRPGLLRTHVFDTPDGWRLIIARVQGPTDETVQQLFITAAPWNEAAEEDMLPRHYPADERVAQLLCLIMGQVDKLMGGSALPLAGGVCTIKDGVIFLVLPLLPADESAPEEPAQNWN
jgi:hypothetical protein